MRAAEFLSADPLNDETYFQRSRFQRIKRRRCLGKILVEIFVSEVCATLQEDSLVHGCLCIVIFSSILIACKVCVYLFNVVIKFRKI